jgi:hypothetical protein
VLFEEITGGKEGAEMIRGVGQLPIDPIPTRIPKAKICKVGETV